MKYSMRFLLVGVLALMVIACSAHAPVQKGESASSSDLSYRPPVGLMIVDGLIVRPLLIAPCAVSTAVYVALSPAFYMGGIGEPMARAMVETPLRFEAIRPLGDFTGRTKDNRPIYTQTEW